MSVPVWLVRQPCAIGDAVDNAQIVSLVESSELELELDVCASVGSCVLDLDYIVNNIEMNEIIEKYS